MTEQGLKTLMDKLPDIYTTAIINFAYFGEATRVCERLKETETSFYADKMINYLNQLKALCTCIMDEIKNIKTIQYANNGDIRGEALCLVDVHAKSMFDAIDEFEEKRNNLFVYQDFNKFVEPKMGQYYRDLIKTEDKKQDSSTVPAQSDGGAPSQESDAVEI